MKKYFGSALLGIVGALVISTGASAAVVCNEDGDCWKVKDRHTYPPQANLRVYDDDWKWAKASFYVSRTTVAARYSRR